MLRHRPGPRGGMRMNELGYVGYLPSRDPPPEKLGDMVLKRPGSASTTREMPTRDALLKIVLVDEAHRREPITWQRRPRRTWLRLGRRR
jgi:hypothetical protein